MKKALMFFAVWVGGMLISKSLLLVPLTQFTKDPTDISLLMYLTLLTWTIVSLIVTAMVE